MTEIDEIIQDVQALAPGESLAQFRAKLALDEDCRLVVDAVERNPGLASKAAIAAVTRLTSERVAACISRINSAETDFDRVEYRYQVVRVKQGLYAGQYVCGWFPMSEPAYHTAMDDADYHSARVEQGVRESRKTRLAYAEDVAPAEAVKILKRLGMTWDELDAEDRETVSALVREEQQLREETT